MIFVNPDTGEVTGPFLRTPYNYDMDAASKETGLLCLDESRAIQSEAENCDINVIMERFGQGHAVPENFRAPEFGDYVDVGDYKSSIDAAIRAEDAFMELPAKVRARFANDPQQLLEFVADPKNREEAQTIGLVAKPPAPPEPLAVRVVPEPSPAPAGGTVLP